MNYDEKRNSGPRIRPKKAEHKHHGKMPHGWPVPLEVPELELELILIQAHITQKPVLRVEVGARALRPVF